MKIFALDDSQAYLAIARRIATAAGHTLIGVSQWSEVGEILSREKPDIALIDLNMPVLEGLKVVDVLRRHWSRLPIVLMSGEPRSVREREVLASGADGYLRKQDITRALDDVLAAAAARATARTQAPAPAPATDDLGEIVASARGGSASRRIRLWNGIPILIEHFVPEPEPSAADQTGPIRCAVPLPEGPETNARPLPEKARILWVKGQGATKADDVLIHVGRDPASQVYLPHSRVSKYHATIRRLEDKTWVVQDHGSSNGTAVNGKRLPRRQPQKLADGDVLVIGETAILRPFFRPEALFDRLAAERRL